MTTDDILSLLLLAAIGIVVLGPLLFLMWIQARRLFRAMIALRDRIDRSQRH